MTIKLNLKLLTYLPDYLSLLFNLKHLGFIAVIVQKQNKLIKFNLTCPPEFLSDIIELIDSIIFVKTGTGNALEILMALAQGKLLYYSYIFPALNMQSMKHNNIQKKGHGPF